MTQARDLGDAANKANFLDNVSSDLQTQITANILPAGLILPFGNTSAPSGYLACDGSAVSRTTYATLFAAIGTTWGAGNGSSTFNVPDLRGAFLRGAGENGTHTMANGNLYNGPAVGLFENDLMQAHKHRYLNPNVLSVQSGSSVPHHGGNNLNTTLTTTTEADGTNGTPRTGDETRPFNAGILYCIKT